MSAGARLVKKALKQLRERREELGMSQAALAEAIDVTTSYIGLLERGERMPSIDVLVDLSAALGIELTELFMEEGAGKPPAEMPEVARIRALLAAWPAKHRKVAVRVVEELGRLVRPG
jgi:transcriptional regulator with XRE-family HTH domain